VTVHSALKLKFVFKIFSLKCKVSAGIMNPYFPPLHFPLNTQNYIRLQLQQIKAHAYYILMKDGIKRLTCFLEWLDQESRHDVYNYITQQSIPYELNQDLQPFIKVMSMPEMSFKLVYLCKNACVCVSTFKIIND